ASLKFWKNPNRKAIYPGFFATNLAARPAAGRYSIAGIVANAILMWTCELRYPRRASTWSARDRELRCKENEMNGSRYYFELAVCGLFRAFSRMTSPKRKLSLIGKAVQQ